MLRFCRLACAVLALLCTLSPALAQTPSLSVLTYNVKGLWWPFATGRGQALENITQQLIAQRKAGIQPDVIVLQEAFRMEAKAIAARAGYKYIVFGPGRSDTVTTQRSDADAKFVAARAFFKGEELGKAVGSGLVIASDYPIVESYKMAFPRHACGGFDCLAAKGVLMAYVAVPGTTAPIAIATTHMNSRTASGVSPERADYAFAWQVDAMDAFFQAHLSADCPIIFAGDFNAAPFPERRAMLFAKPPGLAFVTSKSDALAGWDVYRSALEETAVKDRHYIRSGTKSVIAPIGYRISFGKEPDGSTLSDHIGYEVTYSLAPAAPVDGDILIAANRALLSGR